MTHNENSFIAATENYKISQGTFDFLICKKEDTEDNRDVKIKCKFLKTAIRKVIDLIDANEEIIDYEVAVKNGAHTTFINLNSLKNGHPIHAYTS